MQLAVPLNRMRALPVLAKTGLVAGGYVAALLLAIGVVSLYIDRTDGPDRDLYSGMYAFGDALLFLMVFGVASIVPTLLMIWFLAQSRKFWVGLSFLALGAAAATLAAVAVVVANPPNEALTGIYAFAILSVPLIFASPFLFVSFSVCAWFSPEGSIRSCLLGAAAIEFACSAYGFVHWFL
jgi:hypothetical protein